MTEAAYFVRKEDVVDDELKSCDAVYVFGRMWWPTCAGRTSFASLISC